MGMPFYKDTMSHGNMYIEFDVEYPKKNSLNPEKVKILQEVLNGGVTMEEESPPPSKKKASKKDIHHLEDFSEADLNKNPKGKVSSSHQHQHDEDDENEGGRTKCQAQ